MAKKTLKKSPKKAVKKAVKKVAKKATKKATKKVAKKAAKPAKKNAVKKVATKKAVSSVKKTSSKFTPHASSLKTGNAAPVFEGIDQNGKVIRSSDLKGKTIILYFYPKDDTPGCTAEACSLRDEYTYLSKKNYVVLGVSADDQKSHTKFANKYSLPFSLIADTNKSIIKAFDVWGKKQFMGRIFDGIIRTTFVIDPKGIIKNVIKEVNTKDHAKQILSMQE